MQSNKIEKLCIQSTMVHEKWSLRERNLHIEHKVMCFIRERSSANRAILKMNYWETSDLPRRESKSSGERNALNSTESRVFLRKRIQGEMYLRRKFLWQDWIEERIFITTTIGSWTRGIARSFSNTSEQITHNSCNIIFDY